VIDCGGLCYHLSERKRGVELLLHPNGGSLESYGIVVGAHC
jgi:hypothetical protein